MRTGRFAICSKAHRAIIPTPQLDGLAIGDRTRATAQRRSSTSINGSSHSLLIMERRTTRIWRPTEIGRSFGAATAAGCAAYLRDRQFIHVAGGLLAPPAAKSPPDGRNGELGRPRAVGPVLLQFDRRRRAARPGAWISAHQVGRRSCWSNCGDVTGRRGHQWVRQQTNHCLRQGVVVRQCDPARTSSDAWGRLAHELEEISHALLGEKPQRDAIRFLEGRFEASRLGRRRLFVAISQGGAGRIEAFLICNPMSAGRSWAFETYRRRPDAVRGAMPYLMHQAMVHLQSEGSDSVSLCLVPGLHCETPLPGDSALAAERGAGDALLQFHSRHARHVSLQKSIPPALRESLSGSSPGRVAGFRMVAGAGAGRTRSGTRHLMRQAVQRLRSAASRRTLSPLRPAA